MGRFRAYQDPDTYANNGSISMTPQVSRIPAPVGEAFSAHRVVLHSGPIINRYWYPRAWVAPNGKVFGISTGDDVVPRPEPATAVFPSSDPFKTGVNDVTWSECRSHERRGHVCAGPHSSSRRQRLPRRGWPLHGSEGRSQPWSTSREAIPS